MSVNDLTMQYVIMEDSSESSGVISSTSSELEEEEMILINTIIQIEQRNIPKMERGKYAFMVLNDFSEEEFVKHFRYIYAGAPCFLRIRGGVLELCWTPKGGFLRGGIIYNEEVLSVALTFEKARGG